MSKYVDRVLAELKEKNAHEAEFLQTAEEVLSTLGPELQPGWLPDRTDVP